MSITISCKEYRQLLLASEKLDRLSALGVDNWDGCEDLHDLEYFGYTLKGYEEALKEEYPDNAD